MLRDSGSHDCLHEILKVLACACTRVADQTQGFMKEVPGTACRLTGTASQPQHETLGKACQALQPALPVGRLQGLEAPLSVVHDMVWKLRAVGLGLVQPVETTACYSRVLQMSRLLHAAAAAA